MRDILEHAAKIKLLIFDVVVDLPVMRQPGLSVAAQDAHYLVD